VAVPEVERDTERPSSIDVHRRQPVISQSLEQVLAAGEDADASSRERGEQVTTQQVECRTCLPEMVDMLQHDSAWSGEQFLQLHGQP